MAIGSAQRFIAGKKRQKRRDLFNLGEFASDLSNLEKSKCINHVVSMPLSRFLSGNSESTV